MKVLSVKEFNQTVKSILDQTMPVFAVQGEIGKVNLRGGNLAFFDLKDEDGMSVVKCFQVLSTKHWTIEDGTEVKVIGKPSIFLKNAGFHIKVSDIEPVGEGAFKKAFEKLKAALEKEGLFAPEHKQILPRFPSTIALITSPDADAKKDVLRILKNRWTGFTVKFFPTTVQGRGAVKDITGALKAMNEASGIDVCILTRGGGSFEDLQAFNSEEVARAIFASRTPIVVGIGHEADITIADLVADVRASTPSNAAELVVPDRKTVLRDITVYQNQLVQIMTDIVQERHNTIDDAIRRIEQSLDDHLDDVRSTTERLQQAWTIFREKMIQNEAAITSYVQRINTSSSYIVKQAVQNIRQKEQLLNSLNPTNILDRGYSVTHGADGKAIRSSGEIKEGDTVSTRLHKGSFRSTVKDKE